MRDGVRSNSSSVNSHFCCSASNTGFGRPGIRRFGGVEEAMAVRSEEGKDELGR